jgi:hypothetical protein
MAEPGWLSPLVAAVSEDPYVMAVPRLLDASAGAVGPSAFGAGGTFDWTLAYRGPAASLRAVGGPAAEAWARGSKGAAAAAGRESSRHLQAPAKTNQNK